MAIGERIGFFRKKRGMTQKYLGQKIGFPERSADVRMAQYEVGSRKPKEDVTNALAEALDVSPRALNVPDIDSRARSRRKNTTAGVITIRSTILLVSGRKSHHRRS